MTGRLAFEFTLLNAMSNRLRQRTLDELKLSDKEAAFAGRLANFRVPDDLDSALAVYEAFLGAAVVRVPNETTHGYYAGSTTHCFGMSLWPHLYWAVNVDRQGDSWGAGFINQATLSFKDFDPTVVRPGLWTRSLLARIADEASFVDGWNEEVTVRFRFGNETYDGDFDLGLLQDWRSA